MLLAAPRQKWQVGNISAACCDPPGGSVQNRDSLATPESGLNTSFFLQNLRSCLGFKISALSYGAQTCNKITCYLTSTPLFPHWSVASAHPAPRETIYPHATIPMSAFTWEDYYVVVLSGKNAEVYEYVPASAAALVHRFRFLLRHASRTPVLFATSSHHPFRGHLPIRPTAPMDNPTWRDYFVIFQGENAEGNSWEIRVTENGQGYHYDNRNGSSYDSFPDGSSCFSVPGYCRHVSPTARSRTLPLSDSCMSRGTRIRCLRSKLQPLGNTSSVYRFQLHHLSGGSHEYSSTLTDAFYADYFSGPGLCIRSGIHVSGGNRPRVYMDALDLKDRSQMGDAELMLRRELPGSHEPRRQASKVLSVSRRVGNSYCAAFVAVMEAIKFKQF
ncbi:hypothetical protein A0H81_13711 [Grifola frondosa]|uniref:Uncharacterized protein n=1 Tax=Grifola frondosa TaxID=5627 RepID=A0A1C7LN22_GRIFR|nr:hypothetical protein A0H81_13711 [Grifola frondosa]